MSSGSLFRHVALVSIESLSPAMLPAHLPWFASLFAAEEKVCAQYAKDAVFWHPFALVEGAENISNYFQASQSLCAHDLNIVLN